MKLEAVIGLEIHIQLKTNTKMFCSCANVNDGVQANSAVCPICLGHPGTLPAVNEHAVKLGMLMSAAINCKINERSIWARKHYFYPDLPKGYQISQYDQPLAENGYMDIMADGEVKRIGITRLHLEEDAAKVFRMEDATLVDFNRGGTPLAEIVSEPDFRTPAQAKAYLQELRLIARYLGVSDADMEKGQLRCDANISLRPIGDDKLYQKTEIKNLNSFKSVERALKFEIIRQTKLWEVGAPESVQSTRGWDENSGQTVLQRTKEEAADYRYYPDPDLAPLLVSSELIDDVYRQLPELPKEKRKRFSEEYLLSNVDAAILAEDKNLADFFEKVVSEAREDWLEFIGDEDNSWEKSRGKLTRLSFGWIQSELFKLMNESGQRINEIKITPEKFAQFLGMLYKRKVNSSAGQILLKKMFETGADPDDILESENLSQVSDEDELSLVVDKIITASPSQVEEYKNGKVVIIKYLLGLAMRETKGKADPEILEELFKNKLS